MKQSDDNPDRKSTSNNTSHFEFDQRVLRPYGPKTGKYFGTGNLNKNYDGYGRYSDYVSYDSDEFTYAKDEPNRSPYFKKQQVTEDHIPPNEEVSNNSTIKVSKSNRKSAEIDNQRYSNILPEKRYTESIKIKNISASPFPTQNISSIKPKQTISIRKSEMELLDIMSHLDEKPNHQEKKIELRKEEPSNNKNPNKNPSTMIPIKQIQKNPNESKKYSRNKESEKETIQGFALGEDRHVFDREKKKRRVTLNLKGQIKNPTDSLSINRDQFSFVLPQDLRIHQSTGKRDKPEDTKEQQKPFERFCLKIVEDQNQKMDIVQSNEFPEHHQSGQNKNYSPRQVQKEPIVQKKIIKKQKKIKRVSPSRQKAKKSKSKKSLKTESEPLFESENIKQVENKRNKIVKSSTNEMNKVSMSEVNYHDLKYPKRTRTKVVKFWEGEKVQYQNRGVIIGVLNVKRFLELLGFEKTQRIHFKTNYLKIKSMSIIIEAKPKITLKSRGFRSEDMKQLLRQEHFTKLIISREVQKYETKDPVKVTINGYEVYSLQKHLEIEENDQFQILNTSQKVITLTLDLVES